VPAIRSTNPHARRLRKEATDVERLLWSVLRNRQLDNHKFRFQATIGPFVVDFLCAEKRLIVELDGGQHSEDVDRERTAYLEKAGYSLIRFWNSDLTQNLDGVLEAIRLKLSALPAAQHAPSPNPLPQAGEGF